MPNLGNMAAGGLPSDLTTMPMPAAMLGNARAAHDSLQAQLDALEAGLLAPLSSSAGPMEPQSGHSSIDQSQMQRDQILGMGSIDATCTNLQGDEALSLFADNAPFDQRMPQPYPIGASGTGRMAEA